MESSGKFTYLSKNQPVLLRDLIPDNPFHHPHADASTLARPANATRFYIILGGFIGRADALCDDGGRFMEHLASGYARTNEHEVIQSFLRDQALAERKQGRRNDQIRPASPARSGQPSSVDKAFRHETKLAAPTMSARL